MSLASPIFGVSRAAKASLSWFHTMASQNLCAGTLLPPTWPHRLSLTMEKDSTRTLLLYVKPEPHGQHCPVEHTWMEAGPLLESHVNKIFFIAFYEQKIPQGFPFSKLEACLGEVLHRGHPSLDATSHQTSSYPFQHKPQLRH